jgi:hypothetical protein
MKKVLIGLSAVVLAVASVPLFAAFEAHVINVTAHIENALSVDPQEIAFGTVFPEETHHKTFTVALSSSFIEENRVDDVHYKITQKPKPRPAYVQQVGDAYTARKHCIDNPSDYDNCYPDLCQFLNKSSSENEGDTESSAWLAKSQQDTSDLWSIGFPVPCIKGYEDQDGDCTGTIDAEDDYGCDIWVEVIGISPVDP